LRLLGGLTVDEVARSFLVSESTMAKRLVRAKYKIKAAKKVGVTSFDHFLFRTSKSIVPAASDTSHAISPVSRNRT